MAGGQLLAINFAKFTIKSSQEAKGTLYKTKPRNGANFTKGARLKQLIFGDYLTKGLNGYFYDLSKR